MIFLGINAKWFIRNCKGSSRQNNFVSSRQRAERHIIRNVKVLWKKIFFKTLRISLKPSINAFVSFVRCLVDELEALEKTCPKNPQFSLVHKIKSQMVSKQEKPILEGVNCHISDGKQDCWVVGCE